MGGGNVVRARIEVDADVSKAAKALLKLRSELSALERAKFAPGSKSAAAAAKEVDKLNKSISALGGVVDKSGNFINRHATAINQLAFSAARAGSGFANFLPLIARSTTLLAKHEFTLSSLKEKFRGASAAAEGLGASGGKAAGAMGGLKGALSGVSLGATAAIAALALLAVGIGFLTVKLGPLGSALTKAQNSIKLIFEGAGQEMLDFARTAATAFGITEQAALRFVGKTGQLFKSFGVGAESAGQMSKALLVAADVLRSTSTEFIASEEALQAVFDTVAGNVEGLRRFDIFLSEIGLTQVALRNGLKVTTGTFDNFQRSLVSQLATLLEAKSRFEQYTATMDSTQRQAERTKAAFNDIKAAIGQGLAPLLSFVSNVFLGIVVIMKDVVNSIGDFIKRNEGLVNALKKIAAAAIAMFPGLGALAKVLGFLHDKGKNAAESALGFDEALAELNKGVEEITETFNNYKKVLTVTDLEQLVDAHNRLADAIADAARAEKEAEKDLSRARENAVRDREDAQRNLAEVIEDAVEKEFEARKKVRDTEKKNFRDIRDAERALKKERIDSARRVDDAERALAEARKKRADAILEALIAIQDAQFKFDTQSFNRAQRELTKARDSTDIQNARRNLAEEEFDAKEKLALLEEKLQETRLDAYEALKEAERELGNVIEENAENLLEARRKLHDVEVEISRRLYDAQQALANARREGAESIKEAETALERLNFQFGTMDLTLGDILHKLEVMKNTLLSMPHALEGTFGRSSDSGTSPGGFAHGGPMFKGQMGWVGERGPELFIPNQNGQIISNDVLRKLIALLNSGRTTAGGGGNSIVVHEAANPEATAFAVEARIMRGIHN